MTPPPSETRTGSLVEPTHPAIIGYLAWILGIFGAHRFYFGKPLTGLLWCLTGGLLLVGWFIDLFFIPSMADEASRRFREGRIDYTLAWCLFVFLGLFGIHRFYMGKLITGAIFLLTGGLFGVGYLFDLFTLNRQIDRINSLPA